MQYLNKKIVIYVGSVFLPIATFAAEPTFSSLVNKFVGYSKDLIPLIVFLTILYFIYGVAEFIRKSGTGDDLENAKQKILWGIIALFVMVSFWGIVTLLTSDFFGETPPLGPPAINRGDIESSFPNQ